MKASYVGCCNGDLPEFFDSHAGRPVAEQWGKNITDSNSGSNTTFVGHKDKEEGEDDDDTRGLFQGQYFAPGGGGRWLDGSPGTAPRVGPLTLGGRAGST